MGRFGYSRSAYQNKLPKSKYHNRKVTLDGMTFDSEKEATRWAELRCLQYVGKIYELKRQVEFVLIPTQRDEKGRVIERAVKYIADFTYRSSESNKLIVEDVKSPVTRTRDYILKRKMMLYRNGIRIQEV